MVENIEWQPFPAVPPAARPDHLFITTALRTLVIAHRTGRAIKLAAPWKAGGQRMPRIAM